MGIFDGWQFDPGSYAPQQGMQGLLDALLKQGAGSTTTQYDTMAGFTGQQTSTPFQPQYIPPNPQQPLAPLPAPIDVATRPAQNPGMIPPLQQSDPAALPPNAQPAQYQPPAQQNAGFGDRLLAGLQSFGEGGRSGGLIGALTGGAEGFASGSTRQNMTEQALIKAGYDPGIAKTIVKDRGMLTAVLPSLTGADLKPTWGVINEDEYGKKTYGWINPKNQTVTPGNAGGATGSADVQANSGGAQTAGGITIPPVPPGADPKEWRKKWTDIAADAAGGKMTEVQARSAKFASRMELAEKNIKGLEGEGQGLGGVWGAVTDEVPVVGGFAQTDKYQKFAQARSQFITGLLRDESGAAIGKPEFKRMEKELFPQPGDSQEVINNKREARRAAIEDARRAAGPGSKPATNGKLSGVTAANIKWSAE